MKNAKRILSLTLILALLATAFVTGVPVFAADYEGTWNGSYGGTGTWAVDLSTRTLTISGTIDMPDYNANKGDYAPWKQHADIISHIVIEDGVQYIGNESFRELVNVLDVSMPDSLTQIGINAFQGCSSLTTVNIPASVQYMGYTGYGQSITGIFGGCTSLAAVNVHEDNAYFKSEDGVLFSEDGTILYLYPQKKADTSYVVPDGVTTLDDYSFEFTKNLKNITFPDSLLTIGASAFNYSGVTSFDFPENLTTIDSTPFWYCDSFKELTIRSKNLPSGPSMYSNYRHADYPLEKVVFTETAELVDDEFTRSGALKEVFVYNREATITGTANEFFKAATLYGYAGSTAETYAEENEINFVPFPSVTYHGNGGTDANGNETVFVDFPFDTEHTIENNMFTKDGSTFLSWNTKADGSGETYAAGSSYEVLFEDGTSNLDLYAKWSSGSGSDYGYRLTFYGMREASGTPVLHFINDVEGPTFTIPETIEINTGAPAYYVYDGVPYVEGKIFVGWYKTLQAAEALDSTKAYSKTIDLAANGGSLDFYAGFVDEGTPAQDASDTNDYGKTTLDGYALEGVQIRKANVKDPYTNDYNKAYDGLRFVTVYSNAMLAELDTISSTAVKYGYIVSHRAKYGPLTFFTHKTNEVKSVDCTREGNRNHRYFNDYRLSTLVIKYETEDAKRYISDDVIARPYIEYTDVNGYSRYAYDIYDDSDVNGGGCSVSLQSAIDGCNLNIQSK